MYQTQIRAMTLPQITLQLQISVYRYKGHSSVRELRPNSRTRVMVKMNKVGRLLPHLRANLTAQWPITKLERV
jgi:hypothetical protein